MPAAERSSELSTAPLGSTHCMKPSVSTRQRTCAVSPREIAWKVAPVRLVICRNGCAEPPPGLRESTTVGLPAGPPPESSVWLIGATTPVPAEPAALAAPTRAAAGTEAVTAATTAAAVEFGAPDPSVPSVTLMSPRSTDDRERRVGRPRVDVRDGRRVARPLWPDCGVYDRIVGGCRTGGQRRVGAAPAAPVVDVDRAAGARRVGGILVGDQQAGRVGPAQQPGGVDVDVVGLRLDEQALHVRAVVDDLTVPAAADVVDVLGNEDVDPGVAAGDRVVARGLTTRRGR